MTLPDAARLAAIATGFRHKRVLVVGDVACDIYLAGDTSRISREAPVLIIRQTDEFLVPGQAGNTAANVAAHAGRTELATIIAGDDAGKRLRAELVKRGVSETALVEDAHIRSLTKTRILAGAHNTRRQQIVRLDQENTGQPSSESRARWLSTLHEAVERADACIACDYGYGVIDGASWRALRSATRDRGIPLVLDSRRRLGDLPEADVIAPNEEEAFALAGLNPTASASSHVAATVARTCMARSKAHSMLLTRGNKGMMALAGEEEVPFVLGVHGAEEAVDVSGAGDTVAATLALSLAAGATLVEAACLANIAAGIVVMKWGAATASPEELSAAIATWPNALRPPVDVPTGNLQ